MADFNISASQVKAHATCPEQWRFRYRSDKEPTKADSHYLTLGSRVHEAIEEVLKEADELPLGHQKSVQAAIQNAYADLSGYPLPDDFYGDGMDCCKNAAKYIAKREPEIRAVEKRVEYDISRDDFSTGVTAIMDVVTENELWDWKTGSVRDDTPHQEKIQGAMYMAAYFHEYGEPPEAIRFVYIKEGKVRTVDPSDDNWEYMVERARALVRAKEQNEFPAEPGDHCYWCDYEFWCSATPTGMGDVPYEEY